VQWATPALLNFHNKDSKILNKLVSCTIDIINGLNTISNPQEQGQMYEPWHWVVLPVNQFWQVSSPWASSFPRKWHFTEKSQLILSSEEGVRWRQNVNFKLKRLEIVFNPFIKTVKVFTKLTAMIHYLGQRFWVQRSIRGNCTIKYAGIITANMISEAVLSTFVTKNYSNDAFWERDESFRFWVLKETHC